MARTTLSGGRPHPTMREVAGLAGVSLKTVSRVVNDERGVSPNVRDRVASAIRHLGYRPNLAASNLRRTTARTGLVAVLVDDLSTTSSALLLRAVEDSVRPHGLAVLAASLDGDPAVERKRFRDVVAHRVDGLLVAPTARHLPHLRDESRSGTPMVLLGRSPRGLAVDSVSLEVRGGARLAAEHLLDQGHRRLAGLFPSSRGGGAHPAVAGLAAALAARGIRPSSSLVGTDLRSEAAAGAALEVMLDRADPPTAVITADATLTAGALRALARRGMSRSVGLVALVDLPLGDLLDPPLTAVRHDVARLGATAADLLLTRIGRDASPPRHIVLAPDLVARGSGEVAPA